MFRGTEADSTPRTSEEPVKLPDTQESPDELVEGALERTPTPIGTQSSSRPFSNYVDDADIDAYGPLPNRESRLVYLLPGTWSDPINIELRRFSLELDKLPFYEAVSYTWGDMRETITVTHSGRPASVGKSVEALLRRFRLADTPRNVHDFFI